MVSKDFIEALNGSTSAVIASAIVYPLDILTTRIQVQNKVPGEEDKNPSKLSILRDLIKTRGLNGIYSGLSMALIQTFFSNFGYFYIYSYIKRVCKKYGAQQTIAVNLLQGAFAGALSRYPPFFNPSFFTTPISVVTTRLQATNNTKDTYKSVAATILKEEGVLGFWRGFGASMVLCSNPAITYGVYERVKQILPTQTSPLESFVIGAFTKALATVSTYPYIYAKTRLQAGSEAGIVDCLTKAVKQDGIKGCYKGMNEQLTKSVLSQALLFALKDYLTMLFSMIKTKEV